MSLSDGLPDDPWAVDPGNGAAVALADGAVLLGAVGQLDDPGALLVALDTLGKPDLECLALTLLFERMGAPRETWLPDAARGVRAQATVAEVPQSPEPEAPPRRRPWWRRRRRKALS